MSRMGWVALWWGGSGVQVGMGWVGWCGCGGGEGGVGLRKVCCSLAYSRVG